ncbi:MAG: hypothetical protein M3Y87_19665 [Myxococcota bacterium]|nr:hypothetical protein [Myxococcota bacterium]
MSRPIVVLLVLLGSPIAIAHAQDAQGIDPATIAVLHDPARLQLRISVVEADLQATELRLAALRDRTPGRVVLGVGIALAAAGVIAEVVALLGLGVSELGNGIGCGFSTLFSAPCSDPPTPEWITATAIAGVPAMLTGLLMLAIGAGQLHSIPHQERSLVRRRDGRLCELDLLRSSQLEATGDSIGIRVMGALY